MARLKWAGVGKKKHGRHKSDKDMYVSVICVHASTAKAPPGIKQKFLQNCRMHLTRSLRVIY